jgi:hypothetical protein
MEQQTPLPLPWYQSESRATIKPPRILIECFLKDRDSVDYIEQTWIKAYIIFKLDIPDHKLLEIPKKKISRLKEARPFPAFGRQSFSKRPISTSFDQLRARFPRH